MNLHWQPSELMKMLSDYARHTAAKAVSDERQRLARLVDIETERLRKVWESDNEELKSIAFHQTTVLQHVKSWLAGEGGNV